jgi:hypothetical protein
MSGRATTAAPELTSSCNGVLELLLDGGRAESEFTSDLGVRRAVGCGAEDLGLAAGQAEGSQGWG